MQMYGRGLKNSLSKTTIEFFTQFVDEARAYILGLTHSDGKPVIKGLTLSHRNLFIKKVVQCFLTLKLKHMAKLKNEDICKARIRHKYNKIVLFSNQ